MSEPAILVVEDDDACLMVTSAYLDYFGLAHDVARTGEAAISMVERSGYRLILMDVKMRDMDGFEATKKIRAFEAANSRPASSIIGLTAYAMVGDKEICLKAGMNDYMSKPVNYDMLQEKIIALGLPAQISEAS